MTRVALLVVAGTGFGLAAAITLWCLFVGVADDGGSGAVAAAALGGTLCGLLAAVMIWKETRR